MFTLTNTTSSLLLAYLVALGRVQSESESRSDVSDSCDPMDYTVRVLEWVAFPFSRGIFPTQGLNSGLPHCSWVLYQLSHKGSSWKSNHFKKDTVKCNIPYFAWQPAMFKSKEPAIINSAPDLVTLLVLRNSDSRAERRQGAGGRSQGWKNHWESHCSHIAGETPRIKNTAFSVFSGLTFLSTPSILFLTTNKFQNFLKEIIFTQIHWTWVSI